MSFIKKIVKEINPFYEGYGFNRLKIFSDNDLLQYYFENEDCLNCVSLSFVANKPIFVQILGFIEFKEVTEILSKVVSVKTDFIEETIVNYDLYQKKDLWKSIYRSLADLNLRSHSDMENFKKLTFDHVQDYLLPFFNKYSTLEDVNNRILNVLPYEEYSNYFPRDWQYKSLIIMKLGANVNYDKYRGWLMDLYGNAAKSDPEQYMVHFNTLQKLVKILD